MLRGVAGLLATCSVIPVAKHGKPAVLKVFLMSMLHLKRQHADSLLKVQSFMSHCCFCCCCCRCCCCSCCFQRLRVSQLLVSMICRGVGEVLLDELLSCWTECGPGQLAAGPEVTAVQCMEATLQCLDLLLHHLPTLFPKGLLLLSIACTLCLCSPPSTCIARHACNFHD